MRLGRGNDIGVGGSRNEVGTQPWFAQLNQAKLLARRLPAPFVPSVETAADTRYFPDINQNAEDVSGDAYMSIPVAGRERFEGVFKF